MPSLCNNVFTILYILLKKRKLFCWKYIQSKCDLGEDTFVYFFHSVYEAMIYHDHMRISIQYTFEGTYIYVWRGGGGSVVFYPIQLLAFRGFFFTLCMWCTYGKL